MFDFSNHYSVEAGIGSGKSTFLRLLNENYGNTLNLITEPVDEWQKSGILGLFYDDMKRWASTFQCMAYTSRIQKISREWDHTKQNIVERSVLSDHHIFAKMLHDDGIMNDVEYELYNRGRDMYKSAYKIEPKTIIYLKCDPEISYERLKKRNRSEESHVPLEYMKKIYKYHEDWLNNTDIPVITIDVNDDFENHPERFKEHIHKIFGN